MQQTEDVKKKMQTGPEFFVIPSPSLSFAVLYLFISLARVISRRCYLSPREIASLFKFVMGKADTHLPLPLSRARLT